MAAEPKFSALKGEEREQALEYVRARWAQYSNATHEAYKNSATLIATINSGGATVVLAFAGAVYESNEKLANAVPLRISMLFFVLGIALTATAHVIESGRLNRLFLNWRNGVDHLYDDKLSFNKLRLDDVRQSGQQESAARNFIQAALFCFIIGAGFGVSLIFGGR